MSAEGVRPKGSTALSSTRWKGWADRLVGIAVVMTVACGTRGFWIAPKTCGGSPDSAWAARFFDALYSAIVIIAGGSKDAKCNGFQQAARWIGLLITFYVIVRLVVPHLGERATRLLARRRRDHLVIIGLGKKGLALLRSAVDGWAIAIDTDVVKVDDPNLRRRRLVRLAGDARNEHTLDDARVGRAARVVIVTQDDALNIGIARIVTRSHSGGETHAVKVFVHVADRWQRLQAFQGKARAHGFLLLPFSLPDTAARNLLARFPVAVAARDAGAPSFHLVFVGFDSYAEALLLQAIRMGPLPGQAKPRVTVFTPRPGEVGAGLRAGHEAVFELADLRFHALDSGDRLTPQELALTEAPAEALAGAPAVRYPVTAILVHAPTDADAFAAAVHSRVLAQREGRWRAPVLARLNDASPFAEFLRPLRGLPSGALRGRPTCDPELSVDAFGELEATANSAVAVGDGDWREQLAEHLHQQYLVDAAHKPLPVKDAWAETSEEYRESNRRAVDHFPLKLASLGYIVRGTFPRLGGHMLEGSDLRRLAPFEHESWIADKRLNGWRYGELRDELRKRHPALKPFEALSPEDAPKDTRQIEALASWLSRPASASGEPKGAGDAPKANVFRERVIALAGHNVIDAAQAAAIEAQLDAALVGAKMGLGAGGEFWTFLTALAPGSDFVLARGVLRWMKAHDVGADRYRLRVVRSLPTARLVDLWCEQNPELSERTATGQPPLATSALTCTIPQTCELAADALTLRRGVIQELEDFLESGAVESLIHVADLGEDLLGRRDAAAVARALRATHDHLLAQADEIIVALCPTRYGVKSFDPVSWKDLAALAHAPSGTGCLVRDWLEPAKARRARRLEPIFDRGLRRIDVPADSGETAEAKVRRARGAA
jgi:hypothetical protein